MNVLIFFENYEKAVIVSAEMSDKQYDHFSRAHGYVINGMDNEVPGDESALIIEEIDSEIYGDKSVKKYDWIFFDSKGGDISHYDKIIMCGFL